jgi:hypothetical protein
LAARESIARSHEAASPREGSEHALDARCEREQVPREAGVESADDVGEIDGADDFVCSELFAMSKWRRRIPDASLGSPSQSPRNTLLLARVARSRSSASRMPASCTRLANSRAAK